MDSIGNIFRSLSKSLGSKGGNTALGVGLGIPSIIGQLLQGRQQSSYINGVLNLIKNEQNPNWINSMMAKLTPALSQNLIQSVSNPVQAFLGERGLSQAPGLAASAETQALAPYAQQNIQTAAGLLGLPNQAAGIGSYAFAPQQPQSLAGILQLLMGGPQKAQPAATGGSLPAPMNYITQQPPFNMAPPDVGGLTFPNFPFPVSTP